MHRHHAPAPRTRQLSRGLSTRPPFALRAPAPLRDRLCWRCTAGPRRRRRRLRLSAGGSCLERQHDTGRRRCLRRRPDKDKAVATRRGDTTPGKAATTERFSNSPQQQRPRTSVVALFTAELPALRVLQPPELFDRRHLRGEERRCSQSKKSPAFP